MSRNTLTTINMRREIFLDKHHVLKWLKSDPPKATCTSPAQLRYADLFCGCGGLSYGIHSAANEANYEATCALAIELEQAPLKVYKKNIPHEANSIIHGNILDVMDVGGVSEKFTKKESALKEHVGEIDLLVAGPPCQGHSNLNNQTRRNDPRNALYMACIRAADLLQPKLVIIENVPSVIHSTEGVVQSTADRLERSGYYVKELDVHFVDLGIPQTRKRHVLIASKDQTFIQSLHIPEHRRQVPTLGEFLHDINSTTDDLLSKSGKLSEANRKRVDYLFDNDAYNLPDFLRPPCHKDKSHSYRSVYGRLHLDRPAQTLTSGYGSMGQGRNIHPAERRTINSHEARRIQGFPDIFDFTAAQSLTELRKMIANAVPPQLTYLITTHYLSSQKRQEKRKKGDRLR